MSNIINVLRSFSDSIKNGILLICFYGIALFMANTRDSSGDKFIFKFLIGNKKLRDNQSMREVAMEVFEESLINIKLFFIVVGIVTSFINKDIYYGDNLMTLRNVTNLQVGISVLVGIFVSIVYALVSKYALKQSVNYIKMGLIMVGVVLLYCTGLFGSANNRNNNLFIFETMLYGFFGGVSIAVMNVLRNDTSSYASMAESGGSGFLFGFILYYLLNIITQFSGIYTISTLKEKDLFRPSKTNVNVKENFRTTRPATTRPAATRPQPKRKGIEALLGLKDGLFYSVLTIMAFVMVYFVIIASLIREWPQNIKNFAIESFVFIFANVLPSVYALRLRDKNSDSSSMFVVTFIQFLLLQIVFQGSGFYKFIFKSNGEEMSQ